MKNIPIVQWDLRHWIRSLYMKSLFPFRQSLFGKWKPPPESYMIWMPLWVKGQEANGEHLTS